MKLLFFGPLKDHLGSESIVELRGSITIKQALQIVSADHPEISPLLERCAFAVNMDYVTEVTTTLNNDDELALIPPVSGG